VNYKNYLRPEGKGIKLHLGCGDYWFEGYINIDISVYGGTDILLDITQPLPFQDKTVELIEAYEVIEHIEETTLDNMIKDWKRLLIPGGVIKISVPDMDKLVEQYPTDKEKVIRYIYGFGGYQRHCWGYTKDSLRKLFEKHDISIIDIEQGRLPERPDEDKLILVASL
jgi:predicted SAM-dependent methyltransferase